MVKIQSNPPRRIFYLIWCVLLISAVAGCSLKKNIPPDKFSDKQQADVVRSMNALYPDTFKAVHRVILTFHGKDYVLNGYLSVDRQKRELKLVGQNDLGGMVFDVNYIENQTSKIDTRLPSVKSHWLEKTLLRDLKTIYLPELAAWDRLQADPSGQYILTRQRGADKQQHIFETFSKALPYRLKEIRHFHGAKKVYDVKFEYGSGAAFFSPEFILIKDLKVGYRAKINVQYFWPQGRLKN